MRPTLILGLAAVAGLNPVRAESTKGKCFAPAPAAPSNDTLGTAEPPRIPLWLGFDTGTTEDEVRAYDPTMLDRSSARKYPLIPGLEMTAQVTVDPKTHRAISVSLTRTNKFAATKQALIAMFGQPTWKDFSSREVNGDFSGGGRSAGG